MTTIDPDELRVLRAKAAALDALETMQEDHLAECIDIQYCDETYTWAVTVNESAYSRRVIGRGPTLLAAVQAAAGGAKP